MNRIAVLSSGGDGPGFNPCIRAVVRRALSYGMEVYGVERGYAGLIQGRFLPLTARSVGGIMGRGGTFLGTARSEEFKTPRGQREAIRNLNVNSIEGLVVIGGDGSFRGAQILQDKGIKVIGIPGTIDNDIPFADMSIGVDTALNTALDAIDKIKDTASSHHRAFIIEVMGHLSGYLALASGLAGGAEVILVPEIETKPEEIVAKLQDSYTRGKAHFIIVAAEGWKPGTNALATYLRERQEELGFPVRVTVLGYVQRGGSPSAFDRILATRLGAAAVDLLHEGKNGVMVGLVGNQVKATPLSEVISQKKKIDMELYQLAEVLQK